ncbi:MAG TPA: hypothetical protein VE983_01600 [Solirubrobacteraceae bacterium]|nr:hypothetical protein [Solirubrobacteraceae bacterium]
MGLTDALEVDEVEGGVLEDVDGVLETFVVLELLPQPVASATEPAVSRINNAFRIMGDLLL